MRPSGSFTNRLHGRQSDTNQNSNNGNDDQQLDQGKSTAISQRTTLGLGIDHYFFHWSPISALVANFVLTPRRLGLSFWTVARFGLPHTLLFLRSRIKDLIPPNVFRNYQYFSGKDDFLGKLTVCRLSHLRQFIRRKTQIPRLFYNDK